MTRTQRQAKHAAEHRHMRDRLIRVFESAGAAALEDGGLWYPRAEDVIADMAAEYGLGRPAVAAIVAALSPRQRWRKNIEGARAVLAGEPERSVGFHANRRKAVAIRNGADPATVLGGDKCRNFWANLTGDHTAVTIDAWATRAALGYESPHQPTGRRYERLARAYRAAAEVCGPAPRDFQAIVWLALRPAIEHTKDKAAIYAAA